MPTFPPKPLAPAEFLEQYLAPAFAELPPPAGTEGLNALLGLRLEGEGGGEWRLRLDAGKASVDAGSRLEAAHTLILAVGDWRDALWEGRGSHVGKAISVLFEPGSADAEKLSVLGAASAGKMLEALSEIRGRVRVAIADGLGEWHVDVQLGAGDIEDEPTATVRMTDLDLDQIVAGQLHPMEAWMDGRIRVIGDMTLLLQIQAAQMQVSGVQGFLPG
ncbi:MAG: SCP2 sterol-binding domain-containing protein [Myxococcota bacterium]